MDLADDLQLAAAADGYRGGGPFPGAVEGQDDGLLKGAREKGAREEGAGGVGLVVFGKPECTGAVHVRRQLAELPEQQLFLVELLAQPQRQGPLKAGEPARSEGEVGFEQRFELEKRLPSGTRVRPYSMAYRGKPASCLRRVKRSSWAATISPSTTRAAALS